MKTITIRDGGQPFALPASPTSCRGLVLIPVVDLDDEFGEPTYVGSWELRTEAGTAVLRRAGLDVLTFDQADELADRLAPLNLDWTASPTTWPTEQREHAQRVACDYLDGLLVAAGVGQPLSGQPTVGPGEILRKPADPATATTPGVPAEPTDDQLARLRLAIADPGSFLPRAGDYTEPIPHWSARAVIAAGWRPVAAPARPPACRVCGCTEDDCSVCVAATGSPCSWTAPDLCSRCAVEEPTRGAQLVHDAAWRGLGGRQGGGEPMSTRPTRKPSTSR